MLNWVSRFWRTSVIGSFLAGLLFLLPIILTIFIIAWIVNFVRGSIGPDTILGVLLTRSGTYLLGANQDKFAFWLGAGLVLVGIWLLGLIVKTRAKSIIQNHIDSLFTRVPLIRLIYGPVSRVVRLATERRLGRQGDLSNMGVVSCRFFEAARKAWMCWLSSPRRRFTTWLDNGAGLYICRRLQYRCQAAWYLWPKRRLHRLPT